MWRKLLLSLLAALSLAFPAHSAEERYSIPHGNQPVLGAVDAPITMIEFLDFQ